MVAAALGPAACSQNIFKTIMQRILGLQAAGPSA